MRQGRKCGSNWGCYCFLFEKKTLKRSVQCHVFAHLQKKRLYNVLSNVTYSPSYKTKTVKRCPMSRIRPVTKRRLYNVPSNVTYSPSYQKKIVQRSAQCHVFAHLPKQGCTTFCPMSRIRPFTKTRLYNVLPNVTYSPSYRQAGAQTINIQSTLRTAPICVKMCAVFFGSNSNSYTVCTQSDMCVYTHILCTVQRRWWGKRNFKNGPAVNAACQGNFSACHMLANPGLDERTS